MKAFSIHNKSNHPPNSNILTEYSVPYFILQALSFHFTLQPVT